MLFYQIEGRYIILSKKNWKNGHAWLHISNSFQWSETMFSYFGNCPIANPIYEPGPITMVLYGKFELDFLRTKFDNLSYFAAFFE